ncbi:MAG: UDP-N-acetylmuramate--L-alanine ligase [Microbacteriaceae bacterium]|nr:UDP-N-acetylmuramate--L-alanine ligase [Microbacteriaceae bacterium]
MIKPDLTMPLPETIGGTVHFVGIGGSGMSGIAKLFLDAGHRVTGSDRSANAATAALEAAGATVAIGHAAANVPAEAAALVYTGALWPDNPEYLEAVRRGIPVLHRSQALAWLVRGARVVAVAGAHGKTTSTGMIVAALAHAGRNPSYVNGGVIQGLGASAAYGDPGLWVIEADESDGSFLLYDTAVALVTNVDADHLDHYGTHEAFDEAFVAFVERAREHVVVGADDAGARRILGALRLAPLVQGTRSRLPERAGGESKGITTFGESADADVRVRDVAETGPVAFTIAHAGEQFRVRLRVPGRHNAINAAGAFAVLRRLGLAPEEAVAGLESFEGTGRRFELRGTVDGVRVYDDYAHHPTEVAAALAQARSVLEPGARLIAVHQPHLYSRTRMMAGEFAETYERLADHTVVLDVYGAREDPEPGVTGALVADRFADAGRVDFLPDWQEAADRVGAVVRPGDIVMTLSCGDVYRIIPQLIASIRAAADEAT